MRLIRQMAAITLILGANVISPAWSQEPKSWTGYLVDRLCLSNYEKAQNPLDLLRKHENSCSLKKACEKAGYALFANGHWYKLDAHGNKLARTALARSIRKRGFYAVVAGSLQGDTISVSRLREVIDTPAHNAQIK